MFSLKKILFAALFAAALGLGAVQAQDALELAAPETDYGRDGSQNIDVAPGQSISSNYNYGTMTPSGDGAIVYAQPETDYGRVDVWDQGSRSFSGGGSIRASRPVTNRYSYSEHH